jgi:hypothetical protein
MIPIWNGSQHQNARRVGPRLTRRLEATSLFYMRRPWLSLKLTFVVRSAAKAPTVGVTSRAFAHTRRRANTSTPQTSYLVRDFEFIDFLMPTDCRYKIHAMPHLAAMWIPGPSLPTQTSSGRQTYASAPQPATLSPQYDHYCPTGSLWYCPSSRDVLQYASSPAAAISAALHANGPAHPGGRPRHSSRRGIRERKASPPPNHSLSRDVHSGAGPPRRSTAASVRGRAAGSGVGDAVRAWYGRLSGTCAQREYRGAEA